jgi:hypothetical protein
MKKLLILFAAFLLSASVHAQDSSKPKMKDYIMMMNGKMMVMKHGMSMDLKSDTTLKNGTKVMTDGTVKTKDGKTVMLKEGECLYGDGKIKAMKPHR